MLIDLTQLHIYSEIIIYLETNQILFLFRNHKYHFHLSKISIAVCLFIVLLFLLFLLIFESVLLLKLIIVGHVMVILIN
jgi:hypothetical protein